MEIILQVRETPREKKKEKEKEKEKKERKNVYIGGRGRIVCYERSNLHIGYTLSALLAGGCSTAPRGATSSVGKSETTEQINMQK